MNKQEFYEIDGMDKFVPVEVISMADTVCHIQINTVEGFKDLVVPTFYSFERPKQVVIPQFVADWIDLYQHQGYTLFDAMDNPTPTSDVGEYLADNLDIFARAWLDGYEVEQEKLYTVEIPNPFLTSNSGRVTALRKFKNGILLTEIDCYLKQKHYEIYKLTEAEIRKDFEWAWQSGFAKEVEG